MQFPHTCIHYWYCISLRDRIRVVRSASESNLNSIYDYHMLVIAVIDDVTIHVIHYTGEVKIHPRREQSDTTSSSSHQMKQLNELEAT